MRKEKKHWGKSERVRKVRIEVKVEKNVHNLGLILRCTGRIDDEKREKSLGKIRERTPESLKTGGLF